MHSFQHASPPLVLSHGLSCILHGLLIKRIQIYSTAFRLLSLIAIGQRCAIVRRGRVCSMALSDSHAPFIVQSTIQPLSLLCDWSFLTLNCCSPYLHVDCINRMILLPLLMILWERGQAGVQYDRYIHHPRHATACLLPRTIECSRFRNHQRWSCLAIGTRAR